MKHTKKVKKHEEQDGKHEVEQDGKQEGEHKGKHDEEQEQEGNKPASSTGNRKGTVREMGQETGRGKGYRKNGEHDKKQEK